MKESVHMASKKTQLKTIRIKNESAEFFKDKPLNRYVEDMHRYIEMGDIKENGEGITVYRTSGLERACRKRNADTQEVIDKLSASLQRMDKKK